MYIYNSRLWGSDGEMTNGDHTGQWQLSRLERQHRHWSRLRLRGGSGPGDSPRLRRVAAAASALLSPAVLLLIGTEFHFNCVCCLNVYSAVLQDIQDIQDGKYIDILT